MFKLCAFIFLLLIISTTNAGSEEDSTASTVFYEDVETTTEEYTTSAAEQDFTGSSSASRLSPSQTAVLKELGEIWDYSVGLNETTDGELKMTLSSVVQLAYARLHAEPDDTLHRLKYLLEKLRQRIGVSHLQTVIRIKDQDDSTTTTTIATKKIQKIMSRNQHRNKRGAGGEEAYGVGEIERIEPTEDHPDYYYDNSIYSNSLSYVKNRPISYEVVDLTTTTPLATVTPNEKTIHKILHVQDESHHLPSKVIGWKKKTSTGTTKPNLLGASKPTIFYPPINLADSEGYSSENEIPAPAAADQHHKDEPSLEHIANAIVQLLYPLQSPTAFPPQHHPPQEFQFPDHKHLFQHKLDSINRLQQQTESTTTEIDLNSTDVNAASSEDIPTTTGMPPHFKVFTSNQTIKSAEDKFGVKIGAAQANSPGSNSATAKPRPIPQFVQVMQSTGVQTSNIFNAPAAFLDGTRDGFLTFVATLSTLSFATKMVIIFALSISILSILLGVYSLGPPIIAVGILGIMIPICILLLINDGKSSSNDNNVNRIGSPESKINWNDQVSFVLDLLDEALEKYGEMQKS